MERSPCRDDFSSFEAVKTKQNVSTRCVETLSEKVQPSLAASLRDVDDIFPKLNVDFAAIVELIYCR